MVSKFKFSAVIFGFMVAAGASSAALANPIMAVNNSISLGYSENLMNYQEHITPGPSDTESGWMPGFSVDGSMMTNLLGVNNVYLNLHNQWNKGSIAYHGALEGGSAPIPYDSSDHATVESFGARIGKGFALPYNQMITPYIGAGYYNWSRKLQGIGAYNENYTNGYVSLGARYQYAINSHTVFTGTGSYGMVYGGSLTITHVTPEPLNTEGFGVTGRERVSAKLDYIFNPNMYMYAGVSYEHFNYTGAPVKGLPGAYEPFSSTNHFGADVGLGFMF